MHNDQDATLRDMVHRAAKWFPKNEAIVDDICRYTYAELLDKIQRTAKLLHTQGVRKGDRVALLLYPSANHVVALFGAIELGAIPVALHLRESPATIAATLERLSPRTLIYDGQLADVADHIRDAVPMITSYIRAVSERTPQESIDNSPDVVIPRDLGDYELDFRPMPLKDTDTAVIALSSGTTGLPKGAMLTHGNILWNNINASLAFGSSRDDVILTAAPLFHVGGLNVMTLSSFHTGSTVVLIRNFDPEQVLLDFERYKVTHMFGAPAMFLFMSQHPQFEGTDLSAVKNLICGAAPVPESLIELYGARGIDFCQGYGLTETAPFSSFLTPEWAVSKLGSAGQAPLYSDTRIVDENNQPVSVGERG